MGASHNHTVDGFGPVRSVKRRIRSLADTLTLERSWSETKWEIYLASVSLSLSLSLSLAPLVLSFLFSLTLSISLASLILSCFFLSLCPFFSSSQLILHQKLRGELTDRQAAPRCENKKGGRQREDELREVVVSSLDPLTSQDGEIEFVLSYKQTKRHDSRRDKVNSLPMQRIPSHTVKKGRLEGSIDEIPTLVTSADLSDICLLTPKARLVWVGSVWVNVCQGHCPVGEIWKAENIQKAIEPMMINLVSLFQESESVMNSLKWAVSSGIDLSCDCLKVYDFTRDLSEASHHFADLREKGTVTNDDATSEGVGETRSYVRCPVFTSEMECLVPTSSVWWVSSVPLLFKRVDPPTQRTLCASTWRGFTCILEPFHISNFKCACVNGTRKKIWRTILPGKWASKVGVRLEMGTSFPVFFSWISQNKDCTRVFLGVRSWMRLSLGWIREISCGSFFESPRPSRSQSPVCLDALQHCLTLRSTWWERWKVRFPSFCWAERWGQITGVFEDDRHKNVGTFIRFAMPDMVRDRDSCLLSLNAKAKKKQFDEHWVR